MRKGNIVTIYEDPLTCEREEGKARLLEFIDQDYNLEYWNVRFLDDKDGPVVSRWVKD